EVATLQGHRLQILSISFSADGKNLVSSSDEEGRILFWDVAARDTVNSVRIGQGLIASLIFSPDSKVLGVGGFNGIIRLYTADSTSSRSLSGSVAAAQQSLAFLSNGRIVAITEQDHVSLFRSDQEPGQPLTTTAGIPLNVAVSRNNALI